MSGGIEQDIVEIKQDIKHIKNRIVEKIPDHFGPVDAINAFMGALFMGLTFVLKGLLLQVSLNLTWTHLGIIVFSTIFFLTMQIYFIGYRRVINKQERPFGQFLAKRLFTIYFISITVSFYLLFLFNFFPLVGTLENLFKVTVVLTFPCSIGAAIGDLLKKY